MVASLRQKPAQMLIGKSLSASLLDQVAAKMTEKAVPMRETWWRT